MELDSDAVGSEESFTMLNVPAEPDISQQGTTIPTETATASFVFWHHGSGSTTGDRSNVSRPTAEDQGEQGSSDLARHNAEGLNNTGVLQSIRVWTDKTDDNADTWEAASRHFNKVSVSSCFPDGD